MAAVPKVEEYTTYNEDVVVGPDNTVSRIIRSAHLEPVSSESTAVAAEPDTAKANPANFTGFGADEFQPADLEEALQLWKSKNPEMRTAAEHAQYITDLAKELAEASGRRS